MTIQFINKLLDNRRGWAAIQVSTIIAVYLLLAPIRTNAEIVDRIVACVNDDIIMLSELNAYMTPYAAQIKQSGYTLDDERIALHRVRSEILQKLIDAKLTDQQISKYKISVTEDELDGIIAEFMEKNKVTEEMLTADLERTGMTMEDYRNRVREQIQRSRIVNIAVKSRIVITRQDAERYYQENPDKFGGEQKYHLRNISVPVSPTADDMQIQETRETMEMIYAQLQNGAPFAEMARQYSKSPLANTGGDLGYFKIDVMAPEIQTAIRGLGKNEFTPILKTDQGFQIFYVEDIETTTGKSLEEAIPEITEQLKNETIDKEYLAWLENLRKKSHIRIIE